MNEVVVSSVLLHILLGCFCLVVLFWVVVGLLFVIIALRSDKCVATIAAQDDEYHRERMKNLK